LNCSKEGLIDLVAFGALMEVVTYVREHDVHIFSRNLNVHVTREDFEEFRAKHLPLPNSEDASD
jgi:hypothetical protein